MKLTKLILLAAVALFASCTKDTKTETPTLSFKLTADNVSVANAEYDYIANTDGNTVKITLDYLDKANASALKVKLVNLPSGISATGYQETYDYVANKEQRFTITDGKASAEFAIAVAFTAPAPKFLSVSLNGVEAAGETVKLSGSADLTKVVFTYTVSPEDTKVSVGGAEIASGAEVDFSDKINGVTFTLTCADVTASATYKVTTSGIKSITRVWGKYYKPVTVQDTFFGTKVTDALDALRFIAMDNEYIYISRSQKDADRGAYAVKISDPETVVALSNTNINASGVHHTSSVAVADNGSSSVVLLCNLVNAAGQHLYVYKYESVNGEAQTALDYELPSAARLGDKMMVEGDWQNGKLWFYDSTSGNKLYCFAISAGKIAATPTIIDMSSTKGAYAGGIVYPCGDGQYIWGGNKESSLYTISGTTATDVFQFPGETYGHPIHGISIFTINGERYLGFVSLRNNYQDGQFRVMNIPGTTLLDGLQAPGNPFVYNLGDPTESDITAVKNGNGCGGGCFREINGKYYYAAFVTGAGLSLFEIQ